MKTDNYLTLCLEQAAKSPLRYHHGCVIVRGGKIIGQGYNDYRPGFDGGALKHGHIAKSALNGPAMADLKEKLKKRKEDKSKQKPGLQQQDPPQQHRQDPKNDTSKSFVPFEKVGGGGGHRASEPLSMHSEMMAIHSAISASSTLACSAFSREKPCFKLPRGDKRKERLRRDALAAYVERICDVSEAAATTTAHGRGGKLQVALERLCNNVAEEEEDNAERSQDKVSRVFHHAPQGGEKHQKYQNQNKKKQQGYQEKYEYHNEQYDRYGKQTQPVSQRHRQRSVSESQDGVERKISDYDTNEMYEFDTGAVMAKNKVSPFGKPKKDPKQSVKMKSIEPPQPGALLLTAGHTASSHNDVNRRKKHPRLRGADLYVARRGRDGIKPTSSASTHLDIPASETISTDDDSTSSLESSTSSLASLSITTGSLHDELRQPVIAQLAPAISSHDLPPRIVHASRPCYRCISYMHAVGIKRVFWTDDNADWQGGKVAELVAALDEGPDEGRGMDSANGVMGNGLFVTKHEVLMLKRTMWEKEHGGQS